MSTDNPSKTMRLDKFISHYQGHSRKDAKISIKRGMVSINQVVVTDPQTLVSSQDKVSFNGDTVWARGPVYLMLHKPPGYVCGSGDSHHPDALTLLDEPVSEHLHYAGRLDVDTTGLLLITSDGQWSHFITSPNRAKRKSYQVTLAEPLPKSASVPFNEGFLLKGEAKKTRPAQLQWIKEDTVILSISEGKYHQVKRMFAALGNRVTDLHRIQIGDIVLDSNLQPGQYRPLTPTEIRSVQK